MFWEGESEDEMALMNYLKLFCWDRDYLMSAIAQKYGGVILRQPLDTGRTLWVGHTPLAKGKPYHSEVYHLWAIDTGAGSGRGPITVMDMETKEYWQA